MGERHIETAFFPLGTTIRGMTTASGATRRQLVFTRTFDAPRQVVFAAWTQAKKLARWWGPHGMTNPECELDLRVGGRYRIVMRAPNGVEFPLKGEYREVMPSERLVFTIDAEEHPAQWHEMLRSERPANSTEEGLRAVVTVRFAERAGRTKITIVNEYESVQTRDAVVKMGTSDGWAQSLERLELLLARPRRLSPRVTRIGSGREHERHQPPRRRSA
jgi:uncharacterized protein YndB with AHSA1/START domain